MKNESKSHTPPNNTRTKLASTHQGLYLQQQYMTAVLQTIRVRYDMIQRSCLASPCVRTNFVYCNTKYVSCVVCPHSVQQYHIYNQIIYTKVLRLVCNKPNETRRGILQYSSILDPGEEVQQYSKAEKRIFRLV